MPLTDKEQERLKKCVAKKDLVHGEIYMGHCRNASLARWNGDMEVFVYIREKFGSTFTETIRHPEDDDGHDLFWPTIALSEYEIPVDHDEKAYYAKLEHNDDK